MGKKPIDLEDKIKSNSSKTNGIKNTIKVPKQEAVVSDIKHLKKSENNKVSRQLEKQKKQRDKEKINQQRKQNLALKQEILQKERVLNAKTKEEKKLERLEKQQTRKKEKEALKKNKDKEKRKERLVKLQQKRDYGLDDLETLESRILKRKEYEENKKRRRLIIILIILLICMIAIGSCAAVQIIEEQRPKPITVRIDIQTRDLDPRIPVDPNNPDAGYMIRTVYPGDTFNLELYVSNTAITESFPVFVRFRTYIIVEDLSEHCVFTPTFANAEDWYSLIDSAGNDVAVDDWFYYGGYLETGIENTLQVIQSLTLRTDLENKFQGHEFTLVLEIESIQGDLAALNDFEEWYEAIVPAEWLEYMQGLEVPETPMMDE